MRRVPLAILLLLLGLTAARAQTADEKKATVAYLAKLQNDDGGFLGQAASRDGGKGGGSSLRDTVAAVRALHYFGGEPRDREACARYVEAAFDPATGGFVNTRPGGKPDVILTAVGLMGVAALKLPMDRYADPALKYMGEHARGFEGIRMAAAGAEAAGKLPAEAGEWLRQLADMRNPDGTFGKGDGRARATGGAVAAVLRLGGKVAERGNVLKALRAGQRKDGGFGKEETPGSDLETTYRVMRCFHMLKEMPDADACRAFVARCRNEDGGYGIAPGQPSSAGATYFAGSVLHWLVERQP